MSLLAAFQDRALGAPFTDPDFGRPAALPPPKLQVGSGWGQRKGKDGITRLHAGMDIGMPEGTPLLAIADGTVIRVQLKDVDAAGIWVGIRHDNGMVSRYLHNSRPPPVSLGQRVKKGQVIGYSGNTGRSDGPHLHFSLHAPKELLPAIQATVGKPKGGWGEDGTYETAIPAEPWVPVDGYRLSTIAKLAAQGIPIRSERKLASGLPAFRSALAQPKVAVLGGMIFLGALAGILGYRRYQLRTDAPV